MIKEVKDKYLAVLMLFKLSMFSGYLYEVEVFLSIRSAAGAVVRNGQVHTRLANAYILSKYCAPGADGCLSLFLTLSPFFTYISSQGKVSAEPCIINL
jgi:hypothetical protein